MEDNYRLKIKIGDHEFEAEGPVEVVHEQFEMFKQLITSLPNPQTQNPPAGQKSGIVARDTVNLAINAEDLSKIMRLNDRIVSLTVRPKGLEEAILLIIFGQKTLRSNDLTTGGEILEGLQATGGFSFGRIDRLMEQLGRDGDVIVTGARRSKRYRLTNTGLGKVQAIAGELLSTVA
jgi:hypothetical protein